MNDVLGDRCLTLILEKSGSSGVTKLMENFDKNPTIWEIKRTLSELVSFSVDTNAKGDIYLEWNNYIKGKYTNNNDIYTYTTLTTLNDIERHELFTKIDASNIEGRNLELIFPLLLVASSINQDVLNNSIILLSRLIGNKKEEDFANDRDVSFIDFVSRQDDLKLQYIPINELSRMFREFLGEQDDEDRWLNAKWVGKALKRLNLIGTYKRVSQGRQIVLAVDRAKEKIKLFKTEDKND